MKIAFFELENWETEFFKTEFGTAFDSLFFPEPLNKVESLKLSDVEVIAIFIYSQITKEVLDLLPKLKYIATMSTGVDHIDIAECKKRGITVSNVPTYGEHTVAEHAFALMLSLSRKIIDSYKKVREWTFTPEGLTGFDLYGKTLGVVGIGNIGRNVVRIGKGFGMNVLGYKKHPDRELEKALGITIVDFETLLSSSDVITLHVPYSSETHHLINEEAFTKMKNGVVIINTSRGGIIDTNALLHALDTGKVGAAGLDVLEEEPLLREEKELLSRHFDKKELLCVLENHMLLSHPNVVITPHNAFNSHEALENIVKTTEENIKKFLKGTPQNTIE